MISAKTFLEKRYAESLELEDAVHTAILTLKEGYEGQMTENTVEIGICQMEEIVDIRGNTVTVPRFNKLTPSEVKDYLANIA
jgi:20S proteasome subunit alpha 2